MIFDYQNFDNNLSIREFQKEDIKRFNNFLMESTCGMSSKIAVLSDSELSEYFKMKDLFVYFLAGMDKDHNYLIQIVCENRKTNQSRVYQKKYIPDMEKEYITAAEVDDCYNEMIRKFKSRLNLEKGGYILDRIDSLAEDYGMAF